MESLKGDCTIHPVQATADPAEVGIVDVVMLGVKAWQVSEAVQAIRPLIGPETCVVTLQNGIEAPDHVAAVLGAQHVLGGLCGLIAFIVAPGHIRHAGAEPFVRSGELDNRASPRAECLRQAFVRTGVQADYSCGALDETALHHPMEWHRRRKRVQGLPTRVVLPRVGYLTLPEYTGEVASSGSSFVPLR